MPLRQQRFGAKIFDEKGAQQLDFNISTLVAKITAKIRDAEEKIAQMGFEKAQVSQDESGHLKPSEVKKTVIENV